MSTPLANDTDTPNVPLRRRLVSFFTPIPASVPAELMVQPRKISGWAAYAVFIAVYLFVFSYSLVGIALTVIRTQEAPAIPAPTAETFWPAALSTWITHAILLGAALGCMWLVCRWLRMPPKVLFNRLDVDKPVTAQHQRQWWPAFQCAFFAFVLWMVATNLAAALTPDSGVGGPTIETQAEAIGIVLMMGPSQVTTALMEEVIVVGLLVVLLTAANRPAWEIYTLAALVKVSYHLTYGIPAVAMALNAVILVWLYRRTGRLWPIVAAHAAYNLAYSALVITATSISSPS